MKKLSLILALIALALMGFSQSAQKTAVTTLIDNTIKTNGTKGISAATLNSVLKAMHNNAVDSTKAAQIAAAISGGGADGNNYTSASSFATGSGILTIQRAGLSALNVSLDGRYLLTTDTAGLFTALNGKVATADVLNALTQVASGKVLDARQGKVLSDLIAANAALGVTLAGAQTITGAKVFSTSPAFSSITNGAATVTVPTTTGTLALTSQITGTNTGTNTGDETATTIRSKLGVTTLSGSNTGDQDLSGYALTSTVNTALALKQDASTAATITGTQTLTNKTMSGASNTFSNISADATVDGTTNKVLSAANLTKLNGIATGATANSSDATLLARANHTGTQAESTVTNLVTDLASKEPLSYLHSKAYGATGNGTTDDAAALQALILAGNNIWLDSGTYKVSAQILSTAARSNLRIVVSKGAVIVPTSTFSQSTSVFRLENITNLFIDGVNVQGNADIASPALANYAVDIYSFYIRKSTNVTIQNCYLSKQAKGGVYADSCTNVRLFNNDIPQTYNYGFWVINCTDVIARNNVLTGQGTEQHDATTLGQTPAILFTSCTRVLADGNNISNFKNTGTKAEGSTYVTYINNTVRNCGKDMIKIQGLVGFPVKYGRIANNTTEYMRPWQTGDGFMHIQIWDCEEFVVEGNICKGGLKGTSVGGEENGIWVYATEAGFTTKRGVIANNTITNMGYHGVYTQTVSNVTISNNIITDWAIDALDSKGIMVDGGSDFNINNNIIVQTTQPASGNSNGIRVTGTNFSIINNTVKNVKDVGILSTLTTGGYIDISGNKVTGAGQQGIYTSGTGTIDIAKYNGNTVLNCGTMFSYSIDFGTNGLTFSNIALTNNSISNTAAQSWLRTWGSGTITRLTLSGNAISGSSIAPTYTMTPTAISEITVSAPAINAYNAMGSTIKAETIGVTIMNITTSTALADGLVKILPVYLMTPQTLTGVKWYQGVQGSYTADNYNGVGLYTYSGGTITLVASSTNDGAIWSTPASNTWAGKAFSSSYNAQAGLYFIALIYNSSAQTTAPSIGAGAAFTNAAISGADFTNSGVLAGFVSGATLPATQAMSGLTKSTQNYHAAVY